MISPLCQRSVREIPKLVKMNKVAYALDVDLFCICFVFHADIILSGENDCNGIEKSYLIQYELNHIINRVDLILTNSFLSFSLFSSDYRAHHAADYSFQVWSGLKKLNR